MTATCAEDGPVQVVLVNKGGGVRRPVCRVARRAVKRVGDNRRQPRRRLQRYGLTRETHEALELAQDARCAICDGALPLRVDHDHSTGRVRGLLCHNCNVGLGHFRDDPALLRRALAYLVKP
jgi:hypothetical protein